MPLISYTRDIPDAPSDPSVDQPIMKINTNSTDDIINVDHYSFNQNEGGDHKQVTFANKNVPAAQTDPVSVLYTDSGTASSVADLFYRNQNAIYRPDIIKAAGVFTTQGTNGVLALPTQQNNVVSITSSLSGTLYTIALTANALNGTDVIVLLSQSGSLLTPPTLKWTFAANTLSITASPFLSPVKISFAILQV